ncbi:MAG TPA: ABC transporter substrate-binding protein [Gammaproteobacteria bacterium]|jgi:phospholipid transport system substrate-binding protein|nr:ABC transporter substrate-binding protein [Gammaproteobacteria bacterium]
MKKLLMSCCVILMFVFSVANAADNDPVSMLQTLANNMIAGLKSNQATLKSNPSVVYSLAYKIVVPKADIAYMSKSVIPPQTWNSATPAQRTQFESEFTKLLVRTYASALSDYTSQTVKFFPVRGGYQGKPNVTVSSQIIRTDGPSISVNYRLISTPNGWKLYDMSVEGVSIIESFRSQFAGKLAQGNMQSLVQDLMKHNKARGS